MEKEARLAEVAALAGTKVEELVKNAALGLLKDSAGFLVSAQERTAQNRG